MSEKVCVCMCVYVRVHEKENERERKRTRGDRVEKRAAGGFYDDDQQ